jgi:hypothetical protein
MNWQKLPTVFLFLSMIPLAAQGPRVVATGLRGPHKLLLTPSGNFLVTEPSMETHSGRVSFVSRQGARRSLFEGLPSGIEVVGGPAGPTAFLAYAAVYLMMVTCRAKRTRSDYLTSG